MKKPDPSDYLLIFIVLTILLSTLLLHFLPSAFSGFLPDEIGVAIIWMIVLFLDVFIGIIVVSAYIYKSKSTETKEMTAKERDKLANEIKKDINLDKK